MLQQIRFCSELFDLIQSCHTYSYLEAEREKLLKAKALRIKKLAASPTTAIAVAGTVDPDEYKIGIVMPSIHSYIAAIQREARNLICTFRKVEQPIQPGILTLDTVNIQADPDEPVVTITEARRDGTSALIEKPHEEKLTGQLIR